MNLLEGIKAAVEQAGFRDVKVAQHGDIIRASGLCPCTTDEGLRSHMAVKFDRSAFNNQAYAEATVKSRFHFAFKRHIQEDIDAGRV